MTPAPGGARTEAQELQRRADEVDPDVDLDDDGRVIDVTDGGPGTTARTDAGADRELR